ncbi:hypothetical protein HS088_TW13G00247 [Tripterygium wilfordii]|uniref:Uncharacterized protein n=1 Tax=Tripterygium wilfordii TaxID=458696 RepID=A0A7J7CTP1_TRIWF|nr:hypothetical protein HS088_TW13G00247 [Tripterygium wilfordii]
MKVKDMGLRYLATLLLLLLLAASEIVAHNQALQVHKARAVRIPEHTCHKQMKWGICQWQRCIRECSEEPFGVGGCSGTLCICTYYCKQPPQ